MKEKVKMYWNKPITWGASCTYTAIVLTIYVIWLVGWLINLNGVKPGIVRRIIDKIKKLRPKGIDTIVIFQK